MAKSEKATVRPDEADQTQNRGEDVEKKDNEGDTEKAREAVQAELDLIKLEEKRNEEQKPQLLNMWQEWCSSINRIGAQLDRNHQATIDLTIAIESDLNSLKKKIQLVDGKIDLIVDQLEQVYDDQNNSGEPTSKKARNESVNAKDIAPESIASEVGIDYTAGPLESQGIWAKSIEDQENQAPAAAKTINPWRIPKLKSRTFVQRPCVFCSGDHKDQDCGKYKTAKDRILRLQSMKICPYCAMHIFEERCDRQPPKCGKCSGKHMTSVCAKTYK